MFENHVAERPNYMQGLDEWKVNGQTNKNEDSASKEIAFDIQRRQYFYQEHLPKRPFLNGATKQKQKQENNGKWRLLHLIKCKPVGKDTKINIGPNPDSKE